MVLAVAPSPARKRRAASPRVAHKVYAPFTLPHFRTWASDLILDTGDSWHPEDFQEWFIEDLFSGIPEAWLIVPEGNTKTTTLAGVALYHAEHREFAAVPVAAASREQAENIYRQAEGFVLRSEPLHKTVHSAIQAAKGKRKTEVPRFVCLEGYRRINHHAGGRIQVFAADDRTGDGVIPTLGIIDEPHRQRDLSLYRTWAGKLLKRGGQLAAISTSGEPGSDFEDTRQKIREASTETQRAGAFTRYRTPRIVLHEWAVPEGADVEDMAVVKSANPFSGITVDDLAEKFASPTMTMPHWLRFVCNRPTRDVECWLGPDADKIWNDLEDPYAFVQGAPTYGGVDVAIKHDTTAAVFLQKRPDGRVHAKCRIWTPTEERQVDVTDVMQHFRDMDKAYDLVSSAYDPRFFDVAAKMLNDEGLTVVEVPQDSGRMTMAVGYLYAAIMSGQVTHDPDDEFTRQVLNAVARFSERGFTLAKSKSHGKIDAPTAMALAFDQYLRHEVDEPSAYEDRGMLSL